MSIPSDGKRSTPATYAPHVAALRKIEPALADELAGFDRIRQVIEWLTRRATLGPQVDMVGQDEFHYDFLAPLPGNRWLVFGVT